MKKLIRLVALLVLFVGLSKIALAEDKPSIACLAGKAELIGSCLDEAYTKWDKKLNDTYKSVMGYLTKDKKTELRNQQRTWLKERAKKCDGLSSVHAIKACNLDEAQLKTLALEDQESDLTPKLFEGDWTSVEEYSGIELGFVLLQKGKNICGTWSYFASRVVGGYIHARLLDANTAQSIKGCGGDNYPWSECSVPYSNWGNYTKINLKLCSNSFYSNYIDDKSQPFNDCKLIRQKEGKGDIKKILSPKEKEQVIKENKWINECLNYEE